MEDEAMTFDVPCPTIGKVGTAVRIDSREVRIHGLLRALSASCRARSPPERCPCLPAMRISMYQLAGSSQPQPCIVILSVDGQGQGAGSQGRNFKINFMS
jgi:hypothetical protein